MAVFIITYKVFEFRSVTVSMVIFHSPQNKPSVESLYNTAYNKIPAVRKHKQKNLEGHGYGRRRKHHHTHAHKGRSHDHIYHYERNIDQKAYNGDGFIGVIRGNYVYATDAVGDLWVVVPRCKENLKQ